MTTGDYIGWAVFSFIVLYAVYSIGYYSGYAKAMNYATEKMKELHR